jgi:hypothetical protein
MEEINRFIKLAEVGLFTRSLINLRANFGNIDYFSNLC